ncbi:MAG: spherulation-specific family 4 protein [Verrucomicrobia bacterium]|nr:spherulation-specific family 4 protein [Verrucomicrobiota bacterium]
MLSFAVRAAGLGLLVPAYFDPARPGNWEALNQAAERVPLIAIMNPNDGPSSSVNPDYTRTVNALRSAGGRVIGYVHTSYTVRPLAEVKADIDRYHAFYTIDGIFIDEMTNDSLAAHFAYYEALYRYTKAKRVSYLVVGNPGSRAAEGYVTRPTVDVLVTFENNTGYPVYVPDPWTKAQPATTFSHLCYGVASAATMTSNVELALARNVGYIYVTDDDGEERWDTLPAYWPAEVSLVEASNRRMASEHPPRLILALPANGSLRLGVLGVPGRYVLQSSHDLTNWEAVATTVSPTGEFEFVLPHSSDQPARIFRAAQ